MPLPNFIIIGAPNAGSSYLWTQLREHPDIYMPEVKEPRFFSDNNYEEKWEGYEELFSDWNGERAIGEASVNYSETHIWPDVPNRIHRDLDQPMLIYIVRNPLERLESCWKQALKSGHWYKKRPYCKLMPLRFELALMTYPHMLETTRYWTRLQSFREYFPDNHIRIVFLEDIVRDPEDVLRRVYSFLRVDHSYKPKNPYKKCNESISKYMYRPRTIKIARRLNRLSILHQSKNRLVKSLHRLLIMPLKSRVPNTVEWQDELRSQVRQTLKHEMRNILIYSGKKEDFWEYV